MYKYSILATLLFLLFLSCGQEEINEDSIISIPVSVKDVRRGPIESFVTTTGTVKAMRETELSAETVGDYRLQINPRSGKPFQLGDRVLKDETVIRLENEELENNIKIKSRKLNLEIAEREFEKQTSLHEKGGVTLRELKNAEGSFIDAQYNYENAKLQLAQMALSAPFNGVIVSLPYFTEGVRVNTGTALLGVMDYDEFYMKIQLAGKEMARVKVGQPLRVTAYNLPNDTLTGRVEQISPAIDPTSRTFEVFAAIDNAGLKMRPGMFVEVQLITNRKENVLVVPKNVVQNKRQGKTIFVVEKGNAVERVINTGLENPTQFEVLSGLAEEERLVVKGFETLQNFSRVKIMK